MSYQYLFPLLSVIVGACMCLWAIVAKKIEEISEDPIVRIRVRGWI